MATYSDQIKAVKAGKIAPVYLLAGGDAFLEDYFISQVEERFLPEGQKRQVFAIDDDGAKSFLAELSGYSLFSSRGMMVVRQAQRIVDKGRDELINYAAKPDSEKCLVLILEDFQVGSGLQKKLAPQVEVVDTRPPFPDRLQAWTQFYAKELGYGLAPDALDYLMAVAGDSVGRVARELEKVSIGLNPGDTIRIERVQDLVAGGRRFAPWHLQLALAERQAAKALEILIRLLESGSSATMLITGMGTLFTQLMYMQSRTTAQRAYTGLNKPVTAAMGTMLRRYSAAETARILRRLLACDVALKSSSVNAETVLVALVARITRGGK